MGVGGTLSPSSVTVSALVGAGVQPRTVTQPQFLDCKMGVTEEGTPKSIRKIKSHTE